MFGEDARTLENSYELTALSNPPPAALSNLAQLADLDIAALASAISDERLGEVEELVDRANHQLREYFETNWEQTRLTVAFSTSDTELLASSSARRLDHFGNSPSGAMGYGL